MDIDENSPTPRSGRKKKSSALSRLAAQKGKNNTSRQSLTGHGDTRRNEPVPKYPIDANVEIQNKEERNEQDDSDEGIGMANSTYNSTYGPKMRDGANQEDLLQFDTSNGSTIRQFKHLKMDSAVGDDDETGEKNYHALKIKGEKRFRDTNSSGEDLAADTGRVNSKKYPHSASDVLSSKDLCSGEMNDARKYSSDPVTRGYGENDMQTDSEDPTGSPPEFLSVVNKKGATMDTSHGNIHKTKSRIRDKGSNRTISGLQYEGIMKQELDQDSPSAYTRNQEMDRTFTMRKALSDADVPNTSSLADRYRDVLAEREAGNFNNHEKSEMYDNLGDLRPGPSSSPPPPISRNYSGSSLQASVLNSIDRPWSSMQRIPSGNTDVMSERSYQSTSALPLVSAKDVKDR